MLPRLFALVSATLLLAQVVHGDQPETAALPRGLDQHLDPMPPGAVARLGTLRWRLDTQSFASAVFSADGKQLLTVGATGVSQLWDVATGRELRRLGSLQRQGSAVAASPALASPDGKLLTMYGGLDKVFRVWDVGSGKELWQIPPAETGKELWQNPPGKAPGLFRAAAFSPDSRFFIAEAPGGIWSIREARTGHELSQVKPDAKERNVNPVFAPDGLTFATTNPDSVVRIWETQTGNKLQELGKPLDGKIALSISQPCRFSTDGQRLAVVTTTYQRTDTQKRVMTMTLWDIANGKEISQHKLENPLQIFSNFSNDLRYLAYLSGDQTMHLHDVASGKKLHLLGDIQPNGFGRLPFFSPDDATIVIPGNRDERGAFEIHAYDTASGKQLWRREGIVNSVAFSPDSALVMTATPVGQAYLVEIRDTRTGKDMSNAPGHRGPIQLLALSPDQKTLTTQAIDGLRQWDLATGQELKFYEPPEAARRSLRTLSANGQLAALMTDANAGVIHIWDLAANKAIRELTMPPGLLGLAFSPDGQTLAVRGNDRLARVWDLASGRERAVLAENYQLFPGALEGNMFPKAGLAFSADSGTVASTWSLTFQTAPNIVERRDIIYLSHAGNGRPLGRIDTGKNGTVSLTTFSPDGRNIAGIVTTQPAAGPQPVMSVVIWETITGKERHRFTTEPADSLTFAPDGRSIAVGRRDGIISLREVATGKEFAKLPGHQAGVSGLVFASKSLISGSSDTTALVWELSSIRYPNPPLPVQLTAQQLEAAWKDLEGSDGGKAFQAIQQMGTAPATALPWLAAQLKPVPTIDRQQLDKLVANLENNDFQVRQQAAEELERIGELALPAIEAALASRPTLDARIRLEQLRNRATGITLTTDMIRNLRALEALERIGTPEAKQVLEKLAQGAGGARLTREAQAGLDWLKRGARNTP